jgi:D-tyrosyl-tRNA(Tyr) deacylase
VDNALVSSIPAGLLVLAGFGREDGPDLPGQPAWNKLLDKMTDLRIFPDDAGKMNTSLRDWNQGAGEILLVSQFTLYADCRKGRRPSFEAASPDIARGLFDQLIAAMEQRLPGRVHSGIFAADMDVHLINWGPVTILLDSAI